MNNRSMSIFSTAVLVCFARTPVRAQVAERIQLPEGSTIRVMLEKGVDARKNTVGDEIIAKTTENVKSQGQVVIPRGSRIMGHLSAVKASSKEELESAIGIVFNHAVLKDGRQVPLALAIQAIAPAESASPSLPPETPTMAGDTARGTPPVAGEARSMGAGADPNSGAPGRPPSPTNSAYAGAPELTSTGKLTPSCHGVLGIAGFALRADTATSEQGSLIVSQTRNVHLDGRTQMMLRVTGQ